MWTDPVMKFVDISNGPRRIVGVVADVDDENIIPGPALTVYHPFEQQEIWGGRLFVHAHVDPHPLISPVTQIIRGLSVEQPVEHAATLEDIRAEVLTPDRLNTLVFGGFACVALAIAVVGVAGVLAFSVSGRTREFGIRLAMGSQRRQLLGSVIREGASMTLAGIAAGAIGGFAIARVASGYLSDLKMPGALPVAGAIFVLLLAAIVASALPAVRAARIDVMEALRSE
jgi:putative ABC transport system permease protein